MKKNSIYTLHQTYPGTPYSVSLYAGFFSGKKEMRVLINLFSGQLFHHNDYPNSVEGLMPLQEHTTTFDI